MDVKPSELEMQVLSVLWESSPLTVRQIMERLPDGKQRAYTTVLTVMQGMTRKKLVTHEKQGTSYAYRPAVEQGPVVQPVMQALLRNVFGGDPRQVVQALLDSNPDWNSVADIPTDVLETVLLYHVTDAGNVRSTDLTDDMMVTTLASGETFTIDLDPANPTIIAGGNTAQIIATDVQGVNGVIHAIDTVILPE